VPEGHAGGRVEGRGRHHQILLQEHPLGQRCSVLHAESLCCAHAPPADVPPALRPRPDAARPATRLVHTQGLHRTGVLRQQRNQVS
jgi:hypothetical protein